MIRLITAAAAVLLLATPAMAQGASSGERQNPSMQNQGTTTAPGSSSSGSMSSGPGMSNQAPADCLPNDPRPACQTAQLPGQEPGSSSGVRGSQTEREGSGSMGSPGAESPSGSSGSSGSMGR